MFASSHRFSLYHAFFADFAAALGFSDPVAFAYILLMTWFLIGAAVVYVLAYRAPRNSRRAPRAVAWAVSVAAGQ